MQRAIRPDFLIAQANRLAGRDAGQGQPRNIDLRRAVSSAYYALYHTITILSADQLFKQCDDQHIYDATRHFQHRGVREVCSWVDSPSNPQYKKTAAAVMYMRGSQDVRDVAKTFMQLQEARHEADYNHLADFTRPGVLALIDRSRDAVNRLIQLDTAEIRLFLGYVAMRCQINQS